MIARLVWIGALLMASGCATAPREVRLALPTPEAVQPVVLSDEAFRGAMVVVLREWPSGARAPPTGRMVIRAASTGQTSASLLVGYSAWCARRGEEGDCLGLLLDGPALDAADREALALRLALAPAIDAALDSVHGLSAQQVEVGLLTGLVTYLALLAAPEPISKGIAVALAGGLIAYLGLDVFHNIIRGYLELTLAAREAERYEELVVASDRYGRQLGPSVVRVVVMLGAVAVGRTLGAPVPEATELPGTTQAALNAGVQGFSLAALPGITSVAVASSGTVALGLAAVIATNPMRDAPESDGFSTLSEHVRQRMAERGITLKMIQAALRKGTRYWDPKNRTVNYLLKEGFASGMDLLVARNPTTGSITTVIRGRNLVPSRLIPLK